MTLLRRGIGVLFVIVVGIGIPYPCGWLAKGTIRLAHAEPQAHRWIYLHLAEIYQLLIALILIAFLSQFLKLEFGLRWPTRPSYISTAVIWGLIAGVVMALVDYAPQILTRTAPTGLYPLTPSYLVGWLSFEGVTAGVSEEILYRGLLLTILTVSIPGRVRWRQYEMNTAGVVLAFIFAAAHIFNFWHRPFFIALGQQVYAFGLGILYAYWREKSGSVVPSTIAHNLGDVFEGLLSFLMAYAWAT